MKNELAMFPLMVKLGSALYALLRGRHTRVENGTKEAIEKK